jgi:hypothetical protein
MIRKKIICGILAMCVILLNCSGCSKVNKHGVTTATSSRSATLSASKQADLTSWVGSYRYIYSSAHTHSKLGHTVLYSIKVRKESGGYYARITAVGWQSNTIVKAKVVGNIKSIKFLFYKSLPNNMVPDAYKHGELLFSLKKKSKKIYTNWAGINPTNQDHKKGQYFEPYYGKGTSELTS